ncbi:hypothetical protein C8F04DRAFT_1367180 [Mycena alexandri]|uniref:Uncharacterized protein n=1 Tax=Mycena alexandri TaxID=1745969 RepID=A0AAD6SP48_9AGAR|nr:hypothetical protein C8F04DRAFT_1367180 [Mycena alexandri]
MHASMTEGVTLPPAPISTSPTSTSASTSASTSGDSPPPGENEGGFKWRLGNGNGAVQARVGGGAIGLELSGLGLGIRAVERFLLLSPRFDPFIFDVFALRQLRAPAALRLARRLLPLRCAPSTGYKPPDPPSNIAPPGRGLTADANGREAKGKGKRVEGGDMAMECSARAGWMDGATVGSFFLCCARMADMPSLSFFARPGWENMRYALEGDMLEVGGTLGSISALRAGDDHRRCGWTTIAASLGRAFVLRRPFVFYFILSWLFCSKRNIFTELAYQSRRTWGQVPG